MMIMMMTMMIMVLKKHRWHCFTPGLHDGTKLSPAQDYNENDTDEQ